MEDDPVSQFLEQIKKSGISRFGATKNREWRAPIFESEAAAVIRRAMHFRRRIGFVCAHNILVSICGIEAVLFKADWKKGRHRRWLSGAGFLFSAGAAAMPDWTASEPILQGDNSSVAIGEN